MCNLCCRLCSPPLCVRVPRRDLPACCGSRSLRAGAALFAAIFMLLDAVLLFGGIKIAFNIPYRLKEPKDPGRKLLYIALVQPFHNRAPIFYFILATLFFLWLVLDILLLVGTLTTNCMLLAAWVLLSLERFIHLPIDGIAILLITSFTIVIHNEQQQNNNITMLLIAYHSASFMLLGLLVYPRCVVSSWKQRLTYEAGPRSIRRPAAFGRSGAEQGGKAGSGVSAGAWSTTGHGGQGGAHGGWRGGRGAGRRGNRSYGGGGRKECGRAGIGRTCGSGDQRGSPSYPIPQPRFEKRTPSYTRHPESAGLNDDYRPSPLPYQPLYSNFAYCAPYPPTPALDPPIYYDRLLPRHLVPQNSTRRNCQQPASPHAPPSGSSSYFGLHDARRCMGETNSTPKRA